MRAHRVRRHVGVPIAIAVGTAACFGAAGCSKPVQEIGKGQPGADTGTEAEAQAAANKPSGTAPKPILRPRGPSNALARPAVDPRYEPAPQAVPPLSLSPTDKPVLELAVGAGWRAQVSAPVALEQQRPVLLVLTQEPAPTTCEQWSAAALQGAFTLCVSRDEVAKSRRKKPGKTWDKVIRAALKGAKERFPKHLAPGSVVTVAYSEVEAVGVQLARESPRFFSRLVLVGSDDAGWDAALADHFAAQGGQRVLFLCQGSACAGHALRGATWLRTAGVGTRIISLEGAHFAEQLGWLVEGDPRWAFLHASATPNVP